MDSSKKLAGKRALVTGSGTGIGREIALELARQGAAVVLHFAHSDAGAKSAVAQIESAGGKATALGADFRDLEAVGRLGQRALEFLGGINCLVNNAGITMNRPLADVTPEQFDTLYHVNVRSPFFLTRQLVCPMIEQGGGVICNISSTHGVSGMPDHSVYAGTKGAIIASTRQLAIELAPRGVRVVGIAPGAVVVDNYYKAMPGFDPAALARNVPAGFAAGPLDIARVAAFLLSDDARYIVGQTLIVDGGTTSWMPFGDQFRQPIASQFGQGYVPGV